MKKVAILQSNYIPWKGYFDLINKVDEFILYDTMQFTKRDWRNRNIIKTSDGLKWLTIPILTKGKYYQRICDTKIMGKDWIDKHWQALIHNYRKARYFDDYAEVIFNTYENCRAEDNLSQVNYLFIKTICKELEIDTKITWDIDYGVDSEDKNTRLIKLCQAAGATNYLSGPAARVYLDETEFRTAGLDVQFMDYSGYGEYPQLGSPFEHGVTILDLIFNTGPEARRWMRSCNPL